MGLDIISKSDIDYHASYSGMHRIRYMAYRAAGGKKDFGKWQLIQQQANDPDWPYALCLLFYPNLFWHSDAEGTYTLRGKPDFTEGKLLTGNSKQLLWELDDVEEMLNEGDSRKIFPELDWELFHTFHNLVKDTVQNHDGRIEFL